MQGDRGASETMGAVLMVAVVVVSVSALSVGLVAMRSTGPTAPQVTLDGSLTTENVSVTNTGGASLNAAALRVIVREHSGTQVAFTPDAANVSGTDSRFDPGETYSRAHGLTLQSGDRATVLVVHEPSATVLFSGTLTVAAASGSGGGGEENVETVNTYTMQQNEVITLTSGLAGASYEWQSADPLGALSRDDESTPTFQVQQNITADRTIDVFVKVRYANGSSVTRKVRVHVKPAKDTEPPSISTYRVTASNGSLEISFESTEELRKVRVKVKGPETMTLTEADFVASNESGTWQYRADVPVEDAGTYEATLMEARDRAMNDYGGNRTGSARVGSDTQPPIPTPPAFADLDQDGVFDPSVDVNITAEVQDGTYVTNASTNVVVTSEVNEIRADTVRFEGGSVTLHTSVTATYGVRLVAKSGDVNAGGVSIASGNGNAVVLRADSGTVVVDGSTIDSTGGLTIAGSVSGDSAVLEAQNAVTIGGNSERVDLTEAVVDNAEGSSGIAIRGSDVTLTGARVLAGQSLTVNGGTIEANDAVLDNSAGSSPLKVSGERFGGSNVTLRTANDLTVDVGTVDVSAVAIRAPGNVKIGSGGSEVTLAGGSLRTTDYGSVTVRANEVTIRDLTVRSIQGVTFEATRGPLTVVGADVGVTSSYASVELLASESLTVRESTVVSGDESGAVSVSGGTVVVEDATLVGGTSGGGSVSVTGRTATVENVTARAYGTISVTASDGELAMTRSVVEAVANYGDVALGSKGDMNLTGSTLRGGNAVTADLGKGSATLTVTNVLVDDADDTLVYDPNGIDVVGEGRMRGGAVAKQ